MLVKNNHDILKRLGKITTGLYNSANYHRYQEWKQTGKIPNYFQQEPVFKNHVLSRLLHSQVAQQTLKELDRAWKSWYGLRKKNPDARPPKYRKPKTPVSIWFTPSSFKIVNDREIRLSIGNLKLEKPFIYLKIVPDSRFDLTELRVKMINVVFDGDKVYACACVESQEPQLQESQTLISFDLGVINLVASTDDKGHQELVSGRELLSIQRYFNKKVGKLQSKLKEDQYSTKAIRRLRRKQSRQIKHRLHIVTKYLANQAEDKKATILVGDLNGLKRSNSKKKIKNDDGSVTKKRQMSAHSGQKVHSWSYATFTSLLEYKCKEGGVDILKVSERFTSRTCPSCGLVKKSSRVKRGLFRCRRCGYECNADINGAKNILLLNVSPMSFDRGVVVDGTDQSILKFDENQILRCGESTGL